MCVRGWCAARSPFIIIRMSPNSRCTKGGCSLSNAQFRRIDGAPYCDAHYREELIDRLHGAYDQWVRDDHLNDATWKVIARVFGELHENGGDSYQSHARIRDRAFDIRRVDGGFEFKITRHPLAHVDPANMRRVVQTWHADVDRLVLNLTTTRDWTPADPDYPEKHMGTRVNF